MSVAWNLDVAMQMSSVLVAGRGCTCCAPRLAVGLRRALSRRGRRAVGVRIYGARSKAQVHT